MALRKIVENNSFQPPLQYNQRIRGL